MRTMTKERKKEGPRLGHKGRADAKASRQLLLLCIPAIIAYILFNYIPMGAAVINPFKNYKFSKGILGSDWCGLANFKWIIQSVALDRALRNTVLYGLLFMVLSPVTNVIIALLLFEITSRRRLKTYQTIITFPNFMSMVIVGYIVYAILSPRTGLMNQIIQFFGGDPVDVYMNAKYWPFILTVVNIWKGIGMGSMMYFAALMGIGYLALRSGGDRRRGALPEDAPYVPAAPCPADLHLHHHECGHAHQRQLRPFLCYPEKYLDAVRNDGYPQHLRLSFPAGIQLCDRRNDGPDSVRCGYVPCSAVQLDRQEDLPGQLDVLSGRENLMNPKIKHSRDRAFKRFVYIFFFLMCACFVLPLIVVISASFTSEQALTSGGFSLLPRDFTLDAYKSAFSSGTRVLRAYGVTIFQAVVGTVLSSLVAALAAYPLSRSNFRFRRPITVFIFFTMLFGAGMIPNYIIFAKYYKLADSIWIYILPGITGGAWNTMVFRTFFKGLPETLFEAAYLDGASELRIFFSVVLPLSTPVFASLGFMALVARWNDYTTSMIYIRNESLYTLQYLLQRMMDQAEFMKNLANNPMMSGSVSLDTSMLPSESLKFAMCVIAAGPMLVVFPFFQKYFAQGLTIGAVKG